MYKLLALDMDGTILKDDKSISRRTKSAINKAMRMGTNVVLCSGRPLSGISEYLDELGFFKHTNYVICLNGALIQNTSGKVISSLYLEHKDFYSLCSVAKELNTHIHAICANGSFTIDSAKNVYADMHASHCRLDIKVINEGALPEDSVIQKVMFIDKPEIIDSIIDKVPDWARSKYSVMKTSPYFLEFMHKGASKGNAVKALGEYLHIPREEIAAIGDEENDLSMIKYAGMGVAMGNAYDTAKKCANYVTGTNENDGVADFIEKFIL